MAARRTPPVVVFTMEPEEMEETARLVDVALVVVPLTTWRLVMVEVPLLTRIALEVVGERYRGEPWRDQSLNWDR